MTVVTLVESADLKTYLVRGNDPSDIQAGSSMKSQVSEVPMISLP